MKTYYEIYCTYAVKGDMSFTTTASVPSLEYAIQLFVGHIKSINKQNVVSADIVLYKKQYDDAGSPIGSPEKIVGYEK